METMVERKDVCIDNNVYNGRLFLFTENKKKYVIDVEGIPVYSPISDYDSTVKFNVTYKDKYNSMINIIMYINKTVTYKGNLCHMVDIQAAQLKWSLGIGQEKDSIRFALLPVPNFI